MAVAPYRFFLSQYNFEPLFCHLFYFTLYAIVHYLDLFLNSKKHKHLMYRFDDV